MRPTFYMVATSLQVAKWLENIKKQLFFKRFSKVLPIFTCTKAPYILQTMLLQAL